MLKNRVPDARSHADEELLAAWSILVDALQAHAECGSQSRAVVDPGDIGFHGQIARGCWRTLARVARRHLTKAIDPLHDRFVRMRAIGRGEYCRKNLQQVVIPLSFARRHCGVVILYKIPKRGQV